MVVAAVVCVDDFFPLSLHVSSGFVHLPGASIFPLIPILVTSRTQTKAGGLSRRRAGWTRAAVGIAIFRIVVAIVGLARFRVRGATRGDVVRWGGVNDPAAARGL